MAPSRQACEILLTLHNKIYKILNTIEENRRKVNSYASNKAKVRFGIINLIDVVGAEVLSAIASVASSVAESISGSVSKMASSFIEAVLSQILKIILSFPTAIFSLVAIPHDAAMVAVNDERRYLSRARRNMATIMQILGKWAIRISNAEYYKQIKDSIPYLNNAILLISEMTKDLGGDNAFFNQETYRRVHANIQKAYDITKPYSLIDNSSQITKRLEQERLLAFNIAKEAVDKEYLSRMNVLKASYNKSVTEDLNIVQYEIIKNKYNADLNKLQAEWKEAVHLAELKSSAETSVNAGAYARAIGGIKAEFSLDMQLLAVEVSGLYNNLKGAYDRYIEYHSLCNTIYNIRNLIKNLIGSLITMMNGVGNAAGKAATAPLEEASTLLEVTKDMFDKVTAKDSNFEMASKIIVGHTTIGAADESLHATITQSLVDMINADDALLSGNKKFDEFITRLAAIPDWDSIRGVWAVDLQASATPPYIQLIADAFDLISKVFSDKEASYDSVIKMNKRFKQLINHNAYVYNTLLSYQPYRTSEAGDLMRILSKAGLLDGFAKSISVVNVIESVISTVVKGGLDDSVPNLKNCSATYKDLYGDPVVAESFAMSGCDIPAPQYDVSFISKCEDGIFTQMGNRSYIENFSIQSLLDDKSFISQPV
jgi:hypothetical protein